jgi:cytochrome P450
MVSTPADAGEKTYDAPTLIDPKIRARPNGFYKQLRADNPVYYDPELKMWLVARFEDLQIVLRDPITFSVERGYKEQYAKGYIEEFKQILERDGQGFFPDAIMTDPPNHTRVRKLMEKAFTAHRVKELEPRFVQIADDLIEAFADKGQCDGVQDIAIPFTIRVICDQLGFDTIEPEKILKWSLAITSQIGRMQDREQMRESAKEICELQNFLIAQMRDRQKTPREDMVSDIVHAKNDDDSEVLTFAEAVSLIRAMLVAGNETTATAMGNLMFILATQPELVQAVRDNAEDERFMNRFVEELLRIEPPVRGLSRMTTKEIELGGVTLPEGAHMLLLYASGNDDPTEFPNPREFDIERKNLGRHIAFGSGVHRCIGAALARMEIKVAAIEIVKKLDNIKLAIPVDEITYLPTVATRSIAKLPLTFTRRA